MLPMAGWHQSARHLVGTEASEVCLSYMYVPPIFTPIFTPIF